MKVFKKFKFVTLAIIMLFTGIFCQETSFASGYDKAVVASFTKLRDLLAEEDTVKSKAAYAQASKEKKSAYDQALDGGWAVFNKKISKKDQYSRKSESDAAIAKIEKAKTALDGKPLKTSELVRALEDRENVRASKGYQRASNNERQSYEESLKKGQEILDKGNAASQSQINQAILDINTAIKKIAKGYQKDLETKEALEKSLEELRISKKGLESLKSLAPKIVKDNQEAFDSLSKRLDSRIEITKKALARL